MIVTIFGGSAPKPNSPAYNDALALGKLLAEREHSVMTGGYIGTMEAISRGANEAGGKVIGVTCEEIESWRDVKPNQWITDEWRYPTLKARLNALIEKCDAAFALPGGPGTLTEIMLMWNQLIIKALPPTPLILIGEGWQILFNQAFYENLGSYVPQSQRDYLQFAPDVQSAVKMLESSMLKVES
ncbi:MAG: LOG family protein [Anaerolineae bacterium]|nr:LOG family protein [Anaerolineae bacterium]